jgi:hypothetical protein
MQNALQELFSSFSLTAIAQSTPTEGKFLFGVLGFMLLLFGGKHPKVVIAAPGAVVGACFGLVVFDGSSDGAMVGAAIGFGLIGGLLTALLKSIALRTAGAMLGALLGIMIYPYFGDLNPQPIWAPVSGALIGLVTLPALFDFAIRLMSPALGAMALIVAFEVAEDRQLQTLVVLSIVGAILQLVFLRPSRRGQSKNEA